MEESDSEGRDVKASIFWSVECRCILEENAQGFVSSSSSFRLSINVVVSSAVIKIGQ
jgi:hypothetical protein